MTVAITALEVVTFLALAAVLLAAGGWIDQGSRAHRWLRCLLAVDLLVLAVGVAVANGAETGPYVAIAGAAFLGMFLLGVGLGIALLRRSELPTPALLMTAPLGLLPLAFLIDAVAPGWGHPAYAETALYLGIAVLGVDAPLVPASAEGSGTLSHARK